MPGIRCRAVDTPIPVVEIKDAIRFYGLQNRVDGIKARAADGCRRQTLTQIRVVRRIASLFDQIHSSPPTSVGFFPFRILHSSVDLKLHTAVEPVPDDARDEIHVPWARRFSLDKGGN